MTLSLAMNGCPFNFMSKSLYACLAAKSLDDVQMDTNELPMGRRGIVKKVSAV